MQAETLGTDLFAALNTVHVKYRGFFVERFVCCAAPLREVYRTGYQAICRCVFACDWRHLHLRAAIMQYVVKACVRGFSEIPTDAEFESGDLSLVMDDFNPGRGCTCVPGYFKRLTVNAKVIHKLRLHLSPQSAATWCQCWNLQQLLSPDTILLQTSSQ